MLALRGCQIDAIKILYGYENINPNTYVLAFANDL